MCIGYLGNSNGFDFSHFAVRDDVIDEGNPWVSAEDFLFYPIVVVAMVSDLTSDVSFPEQLQRKKIFTSKGT